jgi:hypothetical protein
MRTSHLIQSKRLLGFYCATAQALCNGIVFIRTAVVFKVFGPEIQQQPKLLVESHHGAHRGRERAGEEQCVVQYIV